jgi:hypothetical protein
MSHSTVESLACIKWLVTLCLLQVRYPGTTEHYGESAVAAGTTHGGSQSGPRPRVAIWAGISDALPNLTSLEMSMCKLLLMPPALLGLTKLKSLELQMNFMTNLPTVSLCLYTVIHPYILHTYPPYRPYHCMLMVDEYQGTGV